MFYSIAYKKSKEANIALNCQVSQRKHYYEIQEDVKWADTYLILEADMNIKTKYEIIKTNLVYNPEPNKHPFFITNEVYSFVWGMLTYLNTKFAKSFDHEEMIENINIFLQEKLWEK